MLKITGHTNQLNVQSARNDCIYSVDGTKYIDLISGFGSVLLGHSNPDILHMLGQQLSQIIHAGRYSTPILEEAYTILREHVPYTHQQLSLYTGGSEAAEYAIRVATKLTGRGGILGFAKSMHGKSLATAQLGWRNEILELSNIERIPYLPDCSERHSLDVLENSLSTRKIAAVFIEPILGSAGGFSASREFLQGLRERCSHYGTLLVVDEILTGFRAGFPFVFQESGISPDIIIFGKAIGNGFPVSCIALRNEIQVTPEMLPGTTYSENPFAAAAIVATLQAMKKLKLESMIKNVENIIVSCLGNMREEGFTLRGSGALWIMEPPSAAILTRIAESIFHSNILVTTTRSHLRIIPSATIEPENLKAACSVIRNICLSNSTSI